MYRNKVLLTQGTPCLPCCAQKVIFLLCIFGMLPLLVLGGRDIKDLKILDPVKFSIETTGNQVELNEEIEIVVKAQLLPVNESIMFIFKESYAFRVKVVLPEGFVQTGGNYTDFIGTTLTFKNPSVSYVLKGKFTSQVQSGKFLLLRGSEKANSTSQLVFVASLPFSVKAASESSDSTREMITMQTNQDPPRVPYVRMDSLRNGWGQEDDIVEIIEGARSGKFMYKPSNSAADDSAMVIIAKNGRRYHRVIEGLIDVRWFGAVGDSVTDDTKAVNKAAIVAKDSGKILYLPKANYRIDKKVTFYTDIESKATILMNKSTASITIASSNKVISMDATDPGGLVKGSRKLGITGFKGATVLLRSKTEVMIDRYNDTNPSQPTSYKKQQLIHLLDNEGNFDAPLQETYTDIPNLEIRVFPDEKPITVNGLNIEVQTIFYQQTPLSTTRSHITMNGLRLLNKDLASKGYIGVTVQNGYNVTFNDCHVSGFNDNGGTQQNARLGYGFSLTDVYDVKFNRCHIDECKHTIMAGYATEVSIDNCTLQGSDSTGTVSLQPLDAHWCHGMKVTNSRIYSKNGSTTALSVAGGDIEIRNCKIYNCWSISNMSATTPEIRGSWIAEDNYIEITDGASNPNLLGAFSSGLNYDSTFKRTLEHPKFVSIKNNRIVNPNAAKQFIIYRGITSLSLIKYVTERLEIANNVAISGGNPTSVTTAGYLAVRGENKCTISNPSIFVTDQPFRVYDSEEEVPTLRISTRNKSAMASKFDYAVTVRNSTNFSTEVDVDACSKFTLENVDILSTNGASTTSGETKDSCFYYQIYNCSIGRKPLPVGFTSAILNAGSARWMLFNSTLYSNLQLRNDTKSKGPTQFTNLENGIIVSKGNVVKKGSQSPLSLFWLNDYVNPQYFETPAN